MRGETTRLKKRIEKVREEKTKEPLKRGASPLGNFAIEDGEDAPPIAIQLGNALRTNKDQVLNLFKDWDADGGCCSLPLPPFPPLSLSLSHTHTHTIHAQYP